MARPVPPSWWAKLNRLSRQLDEAIDSETKHGYVGGILASEQGWLRDRLLEAWAEFGAPDK